MKRLVIKYIGRQLYGHGLQIRASGGDKTVTIRFRDTMLQERVKISKLRDIILKQVSFRTLFNQLR